MKYVYQCHLTPYPLLVHTIQLHSNCDEQVWKLWRCCEGVVQVAKVPCKGVLKLNREDESSCEGGGREEGLLQVYSKHDVTRERNRMLISQFGCIACWRKVWKRVPCHSWFGDLGGILYVRLCIVNRLNGTGSCHKGLSALLRMHIQQLEVEHLL